MTEECRNDCADSFKFPKPIDNRPGLAHIKYRIGTYSDFMEAIFRDLNSCATLEGWTHRESDDPGIALLSGASVLGDILTFYQELYANEAYLRTATWRESVSDLVRLLGYRLSPGVGGTGTFAFEVKGDKPIVIPAGFPIKAQVEGMEQPADFETTEKTLAIPSLSKFHLYRPPVEATSLEPPFSEFSIKTTDLEEQNMEIAEKDRLMLLETDSEPTNNAQIVVVKKVEEEFDRTNITFKGSCDIQSIDKAYKLGRSFRHFGHNAPPQAFKFNTNMSAEYIVYDRSISSQTDSDGVCSIDPPLQSDEVPLDMEANDLAIGGKIIIQGIKLTELQEASSTIVRSILGFRSTSMTWGALTGATTVVHVNEMLGSEEDDTTDIRNLTIHESLGEALPISRVLEINPNMIACNTLCFYGDVALYRQLDGRLLALAKEDGTAMEATASVDKTPAPSDKKEKALRKVTLAVPDNAPFTAEDFPWKKPTVTVYGNLAEADQGKTEKEAVLGNGDGRQTFQTFKLPKSPLTYHNTEGETPPEVPELAIYVDGRLWKRVPSFFGRGPAEEIYIVREDANGDSWCQFGDGRTGSRLPSGIKNIVALYRTGIGAYGALKEETTAQGGKLKRLDKVQLPGVVSGGAEAESGENAREAAPGKVQSLGRLVSLRDFETETLAIAGVSKVSAAWATPNNVPSVVLTVLMETGREKEIEKLRSTMSGYNRERGPARFPVVVEQGSLQRVRIAATFEYDRRLREKAVRKAIKEALGLTGEEDAGVDGSRGLFALASRQFGQDEYASRIEATIQNVEGVVWTTVTGLELLEESESVPESDVKEFNKAIACDKLHILFLNSGDLHLSPVSASSTEAQPNG